MSESKTCPFCGRDRDPLQDRSALEAFGYNPKSGVLYRCNSCMKRVTEAQVITGKTDVLAAIDAAGDEISSWDEYESLNI